jgi:signal peptidase I
MERRPPRRLHAALLGLLPVGVCSVLLVLWVLPVMPGLAPFLAGWWVLGLGLAGLRWRRVWAPAAWSLPLAVPPLVLTLWFNFHAVRVEGNSMLPTFLPGDVLLVDETVAPDAPLAIYVVHVQREEHTPLIKRLVGLPGQTMTGGYDRVFADGAEVHPRSGTPPDSWNEDRPADRRIYLRGALKLGDDEYFFLGDNPPESRDSRDFGPVGADAVRGRVVWSLRGTRGFGPVR